MPRTVTVTVTVVIALALTGCPKTVLTNPDPRVDLQLTCRQGDEDACREVIDLTEKSPNPEVLRSAPAPDAALQLVADQYWFACTQKMGELCQAALSDTWFDEQASSEMNKGSLPNRAYGGACLQGVPEACARIPGMEQRACEAGHAPSCTKLLKMEGTHPTVRREAWQQLEQACGTGSEAACDDLGSLGFRTEWLARSAMVAAQPSAASIFRPDSPLQAPTASLTAIGIEEHERSPSMLLGAENYGDSAALLLNRLEGTRGGQVLHVRDGDADLYWLEPEGLGSVSLLPDTPALLATTMTGIVMRDLTDWSTRATFASPDNQKPTGVRAPESGPLLAWRDGAWVAALDRTTLEPLRTAHLDSRVRDVAWVVESQALLVLTTEALTLLRPDDGAPSWSLPLRGSALAVLPSGRHALVVEPDSVVLVDLGSGAPVGPPVPLHINAPWITAEARGDRVHVRTRGYAVTLELTEPFSGPMEPTTDDVDLDALLASSGPWTRERIAGLWWEHLSPPPADSHLSITLVPPVEGVPIHLKLRSPDVGAGHIASAEWLEKNPGPLQLQEARNVRTDAKGQARVEGLRPGWWQVKALDGDGVGSGTAQASVPDVTDLKLTYDADRPWLLNLHGTVVDTSDAPVQGATVTVAGWDTRRDTQPARTTTDGNGQWKLDVPSTSNNLTVTAHVPGGGLAKRLTSPSGQTAVELEPLRLEPVAPGWPHTIRVVNSSGAPLAGVEVHWHDHPAQAMGQTDLEGRWTPPFTQDQDGSGDGSVLVIGADGKGGPPLILDPATREQVYTLHNGAIDLLPAAQRDRPHDVWGTEALYMETPSGWQRTTSRTNLPPGRYLALSGAYTGLGVSQVVTLEEDARLHLELGPIPGAAPLYGRVYDRDTGKARGTQVEVRCPLPLPVPEAPGLEDAPRRFLARATIDELGTFYLPCGGEPGLRGLRVAGQGDLASHHLVIDRTRLETERFGRVDLVLSGPDEHYAKHLLTGEPPPHQWGTAAVLPEKHKEPVSVEWKDPFYFELGGASNRGRNEDDGGPWIVRAYPGDPPPRFPVRPGQGRHLVLVAVDGQPVSEFDEFTVRALMGEQGPWTVQKACALREHGPTPPPPGCDETEWVLKAPPRPLIDE